MKPRTDTCGAYTNHRNRRRIKIFRSYVKAMRSLCESLAFAFSVTFYYVTADFPIIPTRLDPTRDSGIDKIVLFAISLRYIRCTRSDYCVEISRHSKIAFFFSFICSIFKCQLFCFNSFPRC